MTTRKHVQHLARQIQTIKSVIDHRQALLADLRGLADQAPALLAAGRLAARLADLAEHAEDLEFDLSLLGD